MENNKVPNSLSGYILNVSPIRQGPKKRYFDFRVQTEQTNDIRAVCFSPQKRKLFAQYEEQSTPVQLKKFIPDKAPGSTDILMNDTVDVMPLNQEDLPFSKTELPSSINLSNIYSVSIPQLISLKAKVVNLQPPSQAVTSNGVLSKAEALLVDPHGSIKIVLWESDIKKVQEDGTYSFRNLRLKKNASGELYVNPAKDDSEIKQCEPFREQLAVPQTIPSEFVNEDCDGEVIGILDSQLDFCCYKCNKKVKQQDFVTCENPKCNLRQKLARCRKQWYLKAVFSTAQSVDVHVVFRHDMIFNALSLIDGNHTPDISKEALENAFLSLPPLIITYEKRTKLVKQVTKLN